MAKSTSPLGETVEVEPGAAVDDIFWVETSQQGLSLKTEVQKIDSDRDANVAVKKLSQIRIAEIISRDR